MLEALLRIKSVFTLTFIRSTDRLPAAHTCFNQLDLPAYEVRILHQQSFLTWCWSSLCRPMTSCAPTCWRRSKSAQKDLALPNFDPRVPKGALIQRVLMAILPVFDFPCWSGQPAVWSSDRTYKKIMIPTVMILRREPIYTRRKRTRLLFGFYHLKTVLNCFLANRRLRMYWTL